MGTLFGQRDVGHDLVCTQIPVLLFSCVLVIQSAQSGAFSYCLFICLAHGVYATGMEYLQYAVCVVLAITLLFFFSIPLVAAFLGNLFLSC